MLNVGFVGWRGLVGSVLMERLDEEDDWVDIEPIFFSTSNVGGKAPQHKFHTTINKSLQDAFSIEALAQCSVIVSCQGGDYTNEVHPKLRESGWDGYWIDASSALRMRPNAVLALDPINQDIISVGWQQGIKDYCGANCTVSLMLMGLGGLYKAGMVEWMTTMTYQAASGAGAGHMQELVAQITALGTVAAPVLDTPTSANAIDLDRIVRNAMCDESFPTARFNAPLAGSLIPWIDKALPSGETKEEWKGFAEGNKILGNYPPIPIDGQCVRIGAMRCHAQAVTIKLNEAYPLDLIEKTIAETHEWIELVENTPEATLARLTPSAVAGTLAIPVGRLRKLRMGDDYLTAFTVGDQLLWGAAEPLRRMLNIVRGNIL